MTLVSSAGLAGTAHRGATRRAALSAAATAAAAGGGALSACAAGGGSGGGGSAPPAARGPATIEYLYQSDSLWEKDKLVLEPFQKAAPQVTVTPVPTGTNRLDKLQSLLAAGTPPDSGWLNIIEVPNMVELGAVLPAEDWLKRDWRAMDGDDVYPGAWEAVSWKGKRYGTPLEANPFLPVFRPDFFDPAGVTHPTVLAEQGRWDWNATVDAARRLTRRGADGRATQYGIQLRTDPYSLFHWVWNNGGEVWNQDRSACLLNQPPAVEAVQFMQDFFVKHRAAPTGTELRDLTGKADNDMRTGAVAFEWQYSGGGSRMGGIVDFPFLVAPEPKGRAARVVPHMNGSGNVVFKGARQPEAAWEWVKFFAGKEADVIMMDTGRTPPRRKSGEAHYAREVKYPPNTKVLTEMARSARMTPAVVPWTEFQNAVNKELAPVWTGQRQPKEALDEIVRQIDPLLKR
jgi:multiple sugar transport system substrate-binding protein